MKCFPHASSGSTYTCTLTRNNIHGLLCCNVGPYGNYVDMWEDSGGTLGSNASSTHITQHS